MQKQSFCKCSVYDIPSSCFGRCVPQEISQMTPASLDGHGWSEGISENVVNFCLDATNINSVFVKFKVSLLADSHMYTLHKRGPPTQNRTEIKDPVSSFMLP